MRTKRTIVIGFVAMILAGSAMAGQAKTRLFILSGQSNMRNFNHSTTFMPALEKAFPDDKIIAVKSAQGGQPIMRWYKKWHAPEGQEEALKKVLSKDNKRPMVIGDLYEKLIAAIDGRIKDKKIDTITFLWMQGESDASKAKSAIYKEAMAGLIKQLRDDLKCPGMSVVIGRISDCHKGKPDWDVVRKAQEDVAAEDPLTVWVNTDDLNDGVSKKTGKKFDRGLHYTRDGYDELGRRFAAESVKLLQAK